MKGTTLLGLVITAAVIGGLAYHTTRSTDRQSVPAQVGKKVLPDLPLNDVAGVSIRSSSSSAMLKRTDAGWVVADRHNYPVAFEKLRNALRALADLKVHQVARISPAQKGELRLLAPADNNAGQAGTEVALTGTGGKSIANLILGKEHTRDRGEEGAMFGGGGGYPDGRYIARSDGTTFLVTDTLEALSANPRDWLDDTFLSINPSDITRISVATPGGEQYALKREGTGTDLVLDNLAAGETTDNMRAGQIGSSLGFLRFDDVADPALTPQTSGLDKPRTVEAEARDGGRYEIKLGALIPDKAQYYASLSAAFKAPPEPVTTNAAEIAAAKDTARKRGEEIAALNDKLGRWIYLISSNTVDSLMPARATLVKKLETPATTNAAATAAAPAKP